MIHIDSNIQWWSWYRRGFVLPHYSWEWQNDCICGYRARWIPPFIYFDWASPQHSTPCTLKCSYTNWLSCHPKRYVPFSTRKAWSDSDTRWPKIRQWSCFPKVQASDVSWHHCRHSQSSQVRNDSSGDSSLPRWTFPSSNIWSSILHCRLPWANLSSGCSSILVPQVRAFLIVSWIILIFLIIDAQRFTIALIVPRVVEVTSTLRRWRESLTRRRCGMNMALMMRLQWVILRSFLAYTWRSSSHSLSTFLVQTFMRCCQLIYYISWSRAPSRTTSCDGLAITYI